ncbi:TolB-like translocation protein [Singulisphaera acidiphila]|uniref:Periplasmic component of the Tol biopolymer transport system n=1 Tax=Singulisphaera acidiphila (strain ATCC BAA-1392 / DSM 18658 / VKM B-2454 / MOB10) TaxID=886293 RepID=L0DNN9_SINAD|nr:PD40 domain-containing protein [Singulisphaera acidiphila]AGA30306.1 periplasmic component of the Tol biopolymer transport system [Singulisphaera acidiphila DSM 18658]
MRLRVAGLLGLALAVSLGCVPAPVLWSSEGRWLAYTMAVRSEEVRLLPPGWLYSVKPGPESEQLGWSTSTDRPAAILYRLWTTRPDTGDSVLLEESRNPLTAPVWRADGKAIAFGRLISEPDGRLRFEVVVQDSPENKRIISRQAQVEAGLRPADLPGLTLAWSSDGRYLAIPLLQQTLGIAIIRVDDGRVLKEIPDACLPSWSPDGTKLAFLRGADLQSLHYLDTNFGTPRHLADIGQACQPPVWSRDKRSVMVVSRRKARPPKEPVGAVTALLRISIDGGVKEDLTLPADPREGVRPELGTSFCFDQDEEALFFSDDADGDQSIVCWFLPRGKVVHKKDNPIDFTVRLSSFAVTPGGKTLGFRAGGPAFFAPPGLWDLPTGRFTPLIPDDSARLEWIATLVASARQLLLGGLPAVARENGRSIERATSLPIPGELAENHPSTVRLRRLGRFGKSLCDRPFDKAEVKPATHDQVDEARLFFDYLRGDYDAALRSLESLEARATSPDHRLRLVSLRAQIFLGKGQEERAERTIEFLQSLERKAPQRFEMTPEGPALTVEDAPNQGWPDYLALRAKDWVKMSGGRPAMNLDRLVPEAVGPRELEAMPFARDNVLELRVDEVPAVIEQENAPPRLVPVEPGAQPKRPPQPMRLRPVQRPPF